MRKQANDLDRKAEKARKGELARVPGYLSVKEAARMLGVSERSVYGSIESGKLPGRALATWWSWKWKVCATTCKEGQVILHA